MNTVETLSIGAANSRGGGVWNLVKEKLVHFEEDTERAREVSRLDLIVQSCSKGIEPHWAAIVISGSA